MEILKAYIPISMVTKSKSTSSKEMDDDMEISGIASTLDRDSDGEIMNPDGMDLAYFLQKGHINWDHLSHFDPLAVIGYPIGAYVKDSKLHLKAKLYSDNDIAVKAYKLMKAMEKAGNPRQLGLSVEAYVLERDASDKKHVKKSLLTDIALTPCPKNFNTNVVVVKSFSSVTDANNYFYGLDRTDDIAFEYNLDDEKIVLKSNGVINIMPIEKIDNEIDAIIAIAEGYSKGDVSEEQVDAVRKKIMNDNGLKDVLLKSINQE